MWNVDYTIRLNVSKHVCVCECRRRCRKDMVFCHAVTVRERTASNTCNAVWYRNACKAVTGYEHIASNTCNAVWYRNACKAETGLECAASNTCISAWYRNACKAVTAV